MVQQSPPQLQLDKVLPLSLLTPQLQLDKVLPLSLLTPQLQLDYVCLLLNSY